jgi:hypothetical protein
MQEKSYILQILKNQQGNLFTENVKKQKNFAGNKIKLFRTILTSKLGVGKLYFSV